jgi:hypothetical protein
VRPVCAMRLTTMRSGSSACAVTGLCRSSARCTALAGGAQVTSACYAHRLPMTCQGRRQSRCLCGGFVYVCKTCGKRGCGIPGCERRGQKGSVCSGCQGTVFTLTK